MNILIQFLEVIFDDILKDKYHRPKEAHITPEAAGWVVNLACTKPKDHALAAELWTLSALAQFVRSGAVAAGHPCLQRAAKATVWRILNAHDIKPHRIRYYLEKRDAGFEQKMHEVLVVYREIAMAQDAENEMPDQRPIYTVSVDEKLGVQALTNTARDLPPIAGEQSCVARDHEYVRKGTVSIIAGIDLHNGHIIAQVHDRHRSREFIGFLKELDAYYPQGSVIRLILDHHSAHISQETMAYLAEHPERFSYVHTPKHGSWLNLIESVCSKMARTFLRPIRVALRDELKDRIMKGIAEMNAAPVIYRWRNFDFAA
ncbi:DDE superfamily endonuclease [Nitrosomonas communis]|uniref:DDE superfamily endonuclease n=1 Tax=Nitrosomonas communis TaxID=44574 RepID=A0A5D3Y6W4_9PROT|nr:DDE superfamily endonuclease [Nitrosomonas communis]